MKLFYIIIGAVLLTTFSGCSETKKNDAHEAHEEHEEKPESAELTQEQMNTVGITVGQLEQRNLKNVVRVSGILKVVPQDMAEVSSLVSGVVRQIFVTEGSRVKKGQVVARLENTEIVALQKNYLAAVRQCQAARVDYQRQKGLAGAGAGVKKNLQQALAAYELARVERDGLARQLRQLSVSPAQVARGRITLQIPVYAPISGVVTGVTAVTGSYSDMQKPLMRITNTSSVYADMKVFEKDIYAIREGQAVELALTNCPNVKLRGEVARINPDFDPQTKAVSVIVRLKNPGGRLLIPSMSVSGLIDTGRTAADAVPDGAIATVENTPCLFLLEQTAVENGKKVFHFKKVKVVTGVSELGYTQVTPVEPLPAGAEIVTANAFYIASMIGEHGQHAH